MKPHRPFGIASLEPYLLVLFPSRLSMSRLRSAIGQSATRSTLGSNRRRSGTAALRFWLTATVASAVFSSSVPVMVSCRVLLSPP